MSKMTPTQALREIRKLVNNKLNWINTERTEFMLGKIDGLAEEGLKRPPKKKKKKSES